MRIHINNSNVEKEGWLLVDKPSCMTSFDVIKHIRRIFNIQQIGHAGTLDPLATGLLPVALRKATKTIPFVTDAMKEYHFTIIWGEGRDTGDASGLITQTSQHIPSYEAIQKILPLFTGDILQIPSRYSAIKINGTRSYVRARQGEIWDMPTRRVFIKKIEYTKDHIFHVECSKGTYIRSLAEDIARHLGSCGYVGSLRRTKVGMWDIKEAHMLEDIIFSTPLVSADRALTDLPLIVVSDAEIMEYYHGRAVKKLEPLYQNGSFCALASKENNIFAIGKIMHNIVYSHRRMKEITLSSE